MAERAATEAVGERLAADLAAVDGTRHATSIRSLAARGRRRAW
jgi:hypothetical protein